MVPLHPAAWIGFLVNFACTVAVALESREGYMDMQWLVMAMVAALILHGSGLIMLLRGNRKGGLVGAIGSALFVPIGLIGALGCIRTRDRIRFAGYEVEGEAAETEAGKTGGLVDTDPSAAGTVTPVAQAAALEGGSTSSSPETPRPEIREEEFGFADHTAIYAVMLGVTLAAMLFLLSGGMDPSRLATPLIISLVLLFMGRRAGKLKVLAFRPEYLVCTPGQYKASIRIPYEAIARARVERGKAVMDIEGAGGQETITVNLGLIRSKERKLAEQTFLHNMEKLGKTSS